MNPTVALRRLAIVVALAFATIGLAGCFNPFDPRIAPERGRASVAPTPNSPQNVVRLFEWCWNNRSLSEYREVFTADFRFQFANGDTSASLFREPFLDRENELEIAENVFERGTATEPPATRIELRLDPTLTDQPDARAGKDPIWHRTIISQVDLTIENEDQTLRVQGPVQFYLIRGDSAVIPDELQQAGFRSDPKRWWIERWEDYTLGNESALAGGPGAAELLTRVVASRRARGANALAAPIDVTFGRVKAIWAERR